VSTTPDQRKVVLRRAARVARRGHAEALDRDLDGDEERAGGRSPGAVCRDALLDLAELGQATCVAAYVSQGDEPPTEEFLAELRSRGVRVLLPILREDLDLEWAVDDADVIVVPALAVDSGGVRLGYGGGSYDRALLRTRSDAVRVALLYDGELSEEPLPEHEHDQRVDAVAMPGRGVIRLSGRT
jgi:5-formyltetrahydrofolate cyclo-ligase